jgi:pimeloyl-ACP methyl ester carboxylesterase
MEPYSIRIAQEVLDDLQLRLRRARLPPPLGPAWEHGTSDGYLQGLIAYWKDGFDWRQQESRLNRFDHFQTSVDGHRIHFIHQRGRGPKPLPIILTHGYPDSFLRFTRLIPLLTEPDDPADAFDVVVPSLPGYAFSAPLRKEGGSFGIGSLWNQLMTKELGYARYGAQGGDWGGVVTEQLARSHASSVIGIHMTDVPFWHAFNKPSQLSPAEEKFFAANEKWVKQEGAYAMIQGTRPQSLAGGLNDSPAGLASWLVEKFQRWSDYGGDFEGRASKDELLSNVMLYWATQTIGTSFLPYYDFMNAGGGRWMLEMAKAWLGSSSVPAAFALFPHDLSHPPREYAERFFNVQRWTQMPRGGHFAAMEEPELLAEDIRTFFRPFR